MYFETGHVNVVYDLAFSNDDSVVASCSSDRTCILFTIDVSESGLFVELILYVHIYILVVAAVVVVSCFFPVVVCVVCMNLMNFSLLISFPF